MTCRLPDKKNRKINSKLLVFKRKQKVTLRELQSLIGLLNFATAVVVPGRTFLRRLYDLTIGISRPHFKIRLNAGARADLAAWHIFMENFNGKSMFLSDDWISSDVLRLQTDAASTKGFAAVFGKRWFSGEWPEAFKATNINVMELFPIVVAVEILGSCMANHKILFLSDNSCSVDVINKASSKCPILMKLVRRLVIACLSYNILFKSKHVPGKHNSLPDALSRFKFQEAHAMAPWLEKIPSQLSQRYLII